MANRNYEQGRRYEYIERDKWRDMGWFSERAYASKGPWDVYAVSPEGDLVVFISVMSYTKKKRSFRSRKNKLLSIPTGPNVLRLIARYGPIKRGVKTPREEIEV